MNQDSNANAGDAPDGADGLSGRRKPVPSLPGPPADSSPAVLGPPSPTMREEEGQRAPAAEVSTSPRRIYVTVEIPGVSKDTIEVSATDRHLTVHGPRAGGTAYHLEFDLPVRVVPRSAKATYRNGVLDITLSRDETQGGVDHEE